MDHRCLLITTITVMDRLHLPLDRMVILPHLLATTINITMDLIRARMVRLPHRIISIIMIIITKDLPRLLDLTVDLLTRLDLAMGLTRGLLDLMVDLLRRPRVLAVDLPLLERSAMDRRSPWSILLLDLWTTQ
jgi:hypothetical protein